MKYLLVEGNADKRVVESILNLIEGTRPVFDIHFSGGFNEVCRDINPFVLKQDMEALGIIVDADSNFAGRWQRLKQELDKSKTSYPNDLPNAGLIITGDVKIGIWIMPDNNLNGMLEDFMLQLIPQDDNLKIKAISTLLEIEEAGHNKYTVAHKSKALIHTWLAWQEDPGRPLNIAINNQYLSTDAVLSQNFINWLKALFIE